MKNSNDKFFQQTVLGHPPVLFVLFFTEMWERFSYYGMRALLVIFLTAEILGPNPGWGWSKKTALSLLGTYAMFVYLTPLVGGWLADKHIGYRKAVVIGAFLMTLGHISMAFETPTFLYVGITLLVFGNGFFKPNITSIISKIYEGHDDKKDGAYNIFYMGVNAGAFLGIMLCGWVGENPYLGWSFGFGLAGIFMFLGMIQFYFAQPLLGNIGDRPDKKQQKVKKESDDKLNPFLPIDYFLILVFIFSALVFIINDPISKIGGIDILNFTIGGMKDSLFFALIAFISFAILLLIRIPRYSPIVRDRMIVFSIFSFFTIFFWAAFEQGAGSLPLYTRDYTYRFLEGNSAIIFKVIDLLVTVIPLIIITYVLIKLFIKTYQKIIISNMVLFTTFLIIWAIVIFKLVIDFQSENTEIPNNICTFIY